MNRFPFLSFWSSATDSLALGSMLATMVVCSSICIFTTSTCHCYKIPFRTCRKSIQRYTLWSEIRCFGSLFRHFPSHLFVSLYTSFLGSCGSLRCSWLLFLIAFLAGDGYSRQLDVENSNRYGKVDVLIQICMIYALVYITVEKGSLAHLRWWM